jgi:hypothetical protein
MRKLGSKNGGSGWIRTAYNSIALSQTYPVSDLAHTHNDIGY